MSPSRIPAGYATPTGMLDLATDYGQQLRLLLLDGLGVYECAWYNVSTDVPPGHYLRLNVAPAAAPDGHNIPELPVTPGSIWPTAQGRCQVQAVSFNLSWTLTPYADGPERMLTPGGPFGAAPAVPAMVFRDGSLELLLYYPDGIRR